MDLENRFSGAKEILTNLLDVGDSYKKFPGIVAKQFSLSNYQQIHSSKFLPNKVFTNDTYANRVRMYR